MAIEVIDEIVPKNDGYFGIIRDTNTIGGFRVVADHATRDAIPASMRKQGMRVATINDDKLWKLASNLTSWANDTVSDGLESVLDGPFESFVSGAYKEILPAASLFPTSIIWWVSSAKLKKIVEETITYNSPIMTIATDVWKLYDANDGVTVISTVSDAVVYSGVVELSRTRSIA